MVDLTFVASRNTSVEEVNGILKAASEGAMKGILDYCTEPLVSIDFNHTTASSTVDSLLTKVTGGQYGQSGGLVRQRMGVLHSYARQHHRTDVGQVRSE
jgi:glyceraldehyde-3-phosphate dehydrogenase/erythrose-4-phosphate dehydrogenase